MTGQPDTFALVKKRWRSDAWEDARPFHDYGPAGVCADELESGLEQRVRELRDVIRTTQSGRLNAGTIEMKLTALLGEEQKP